MTRPWMSRPCTPRPGLIERCLSRPVGVAVRRIAGVPGLLSFSLLSVCVNLQAVSAYTASAGAVVADTSAAAR